MNQHSSQNRLSQEKSPYLLQHAANPVDWYPWGNEAFARAAQENKPIFLSIGYSSCHWCHVMAHESFENADVARMLNECFVCVKVDREERPDIDHIYMTAVMAMTGQGGWPLTVFLTPDGKPFFGGTYFPPNAKWGAPGLTDVIRSIHTAWQANPDQLTQSSGKLAGILRAHSVKLQKGGPFKEDILARGFEQFASLYDAKYGGFGTAPKFPSSHNLSFLLRYWKRTKERHALTMVERTLAAMAQGGIYDHLGGGFHRYATDQNWQIPHFEKMLYDQAMLVRAYLEAYQATKNELYARVARETCDYILRDMQYPEGGFYSAEDADSFDPDTRTSGSKLQDSDKREGAFYVWRYEELRTILGDNDAGIFNFCFDIVLDGNALADPHGEFTGKNILALAKDANEAAGHFQKMPQEIEAVLTRCRQKLFEHRSTRPRPFLDDKILVDWNGLMISSLALASRVLRDTRYGIAAEKAAKFIMRQLLIPEGRLQHRYRDGESVMPGTLNDYAFLILGLLDLYEAGFDPSYLQNAQRLAAVMIDLFWDDPDGGFYLTAQDAEQLLFRPKEVYDGAIPSGNAVAALDLVRLYHITLAEDFRVKYEKLLEAFSVEVSQNPAAYAQMLCALDFAWGPSCEIVLAGERDDPQMADMVREIYEQFIPNKVVLHRPVLDSAAKILEIAPFLRERAAIAGKPTAYVCHGQVCQQPLNNVEQLQESLRRLC